MLLRSPPVRALILAVTLTLTACSSDSASDVTSAAEPTLSASEASSVTTTVPPRDPGPASTTTMQQPADPANQLEPTGSVEGVVIDVEGTLGAVSSFTVRLSDGTDAIFVPVDGLLFAGTAPIDHVRDHMVSGAPVSVGYTTLADGTLSALEVGDA
ncbi:MAG: hypothetical protein OER12_04920 [Acidimicrobiia bacterium]|nr:hypothetical protein [Acidimicrobiia bacterium]